MASEQGGGMTGGEREAVGYCQKSFIGTVVIVDSGPGKKAWWKIVGIS